LLLAREAYSAAAALTDTALGWPLEPASSSLSLPSSLLLPLPARVAAAAAATAAAAASFAVTRDVYAPEEPASVEAVVVFALGRGPRAVALPPLAALIGALVSDGSRDEAATEC
jgi:hypothetical protein